MSSYILYGKRYVLEKRNLMCETYIKNPNLLIDLNSKTVRLYYPEGKVFVLDTSQDIGGQHELKILSKREAFLIMNQYPEGIQESVYIRYFGEPEEL